MVIHFKIFMLYFPILLHLFFVVQIKCYMSIESKKFYYNILYTKTNYNLVNKMLISFEIIQTFKFLLFFKLETFNCFFKVLTVLVSLIF